MTKLQVIQPTGSQFQSGKAEYQHLSLTPVNGALGAEIRDVDLRNPLAPELITEIRRALVRHKVIVFREQILSPKDLVELGSEFGSFMPLLSKPSKQRHRKCVRRQYLTNSYL